MTTPPGNIDNKPRDLAAEVRVQWDALGCLSNTLTTVHDRWDSVCDTGGDLATPTPTRVLTASEGVCSPEWISGSRFWMMQPSDDDDEGEDEGSSSAGDSGKLVSLEAELQKRFEHHDPYELVHELKAIFETHAAVESYEASKHFFGCMMEEGSSVSEHVLAMSGHAKKLSDLGIVIPNKLGIHRVLQSLPPSYKNFVMNYNMQNMNKELPELFSMLKSAEVEIQKEHQVLMVNKTTSFKKQGKPKKGNVKKGGKESAS
ncbi:hypothetical protein QYE76_028563 [Lolium multiflorum]|uniref:Uncharacterized protein n=1 Tax=Lolium multiflorum TaxID=4521 RepID=A0AAD8QL65_LOLMU|nr:hypothetical protein QYE76_028563 [Lolium multiflorum]